MRFLHFATLAALLLVNIAGKAGDALGPRLVLSHPLGLLLLNANDTHLALTSGLPWLAALAVSAPRRLGEDLLYFYAGLLFGESASEKLRHLLPWTSFGSGEAPVIVRRSVLASLAIAPSAPGFLIAGRIRVPFATVLAIDLVGTLARFAAVRAAGNLLSDQRDWLLAQIGDHMAAAVAVTTALTAAGLGSAVLASRRAADHDRAASKR